MSARGFSETQKNQLGKCFTPGPSHEDIPRQFIRSTLALPSSREPCSRKEMDVAMKGDPTSHSIGGRGELKGQHVTQSLHPATQRGGIGAL